ncbi:hypothetical protein [Limnothrix sp. PR1529]|uniref:hypothetical protein n=1 Tax=Limnothrix sp. PR1529 TaxID=1704291 RepID=UPI00117A0256|nr:hypothetical protein [Limnothrix sp. PR1529]
MEVIGLVEWRFVRDRDCLGLLVEGRSPGCGVVGNGGLCAIGGREGWDGDGMMPCSIEQIRSSKSDRANP